MNADFGMLAVIPARGGSKGLPGKNIRSFAGLPLIAHSILLAKMCREIDRLIVTTDSLEIANIAKGYGADVPFVRPAELAQDDTPIWPVLRHALQAVSNSEEEFQYLLLLDPTSPAREPSDITEALGRLHECPEADGIISVSQPDFNMIWHCVVEQDGWMRDLMEEGHNFERRQEVPAVYRINGSLYIWRTSFVRTQEDSWRKTGKNLIYVTPEFRSLSFDTLDQFERAEILVNNGFITLPWLSDT